MGVECPVCGRNLELWTAVQRSLHANSCIDQGFESSTSKTVSGVSWDWRAPQLAGKRQSKTTKKAQRGQKRYRLDQPQPGQAVECERSQSTQTERLDSDYKDKLPSPTKSATMPIVKQEEKHHSVSNSIETVQKTLSKKTKRTTRSQLPFYKILNFGHTSFAVDAFMWGAIDEVSAYFLTHFHSDHYGGLSKNWKHGYIYCSPTTARLVKMQLHVDSQWIVEVPIGRPVPIMDVEVVLLDANHCPGSTVMLFNGKVLHTGDFRATEYLTNRVREITTYLDIVYLDTTYLDPSRNFPSQKNVIDTCAEFCKLEQLRPPDRSWFTKIKPRRILVMVGTYTIGKERLAVGIAHAMRSNIWAPASKLKILHELDCPSLATLLDCNDGLQCQVHLVRMGELTIANLENQWKFLQRHFTELIGFIPTGWTASSHEKDTFTINDLKSRCVSRHPFIRIFRVPYSEHSSFRELEYFCKSLQVRRLIATVPGKHLEILKQWESQKHEPSAKSEYKA